MALVAHPSRRSGNVLMVVQLLEEPVALYGDRLTRHMGPRRVQFVDELSRRDNAKIQALSRVRYRQAPRDAEGKTSCSEPL